MSRVTLLILAFALLVGAPALAADSPAIDTAAVQSQAVQLADTGLAQAPVMKMTANTAGANAAGCSAYAVCDNGTTVSCSTGSSSASCYARDSNCEGSANVRGYVRCGSSYQYCRTCPVDPPQSCSVQGAPCSDSGYCNAKCNAYCNNSGGVCSGGSCQCGILQ